MFAKFRIQFRIPSGIAVCSTKTISEARRLVYLAQFLELAIDSTTSSKSNGFMDEEYDSENHRTVRDNFT